MIGENNKLAEEEKLILAIKTDYNHRGFGVASLSFNYDLPIGKVCEYINLGRTPQIDFDIEYIIRTAQQPL